MANHPANLQRHGAGRLSALIATCCLIATPALAEPVPESERGPVDLRRTTLLVRDAEASMRLYRDVLGLRIRYDNRSVRKPEPGDPPDLVRSSRLVILCANDNFIGCIGLLERKPLPPEAATIVRRKPAYGQVYLVFNVKDLEQRFALAKAVPGVVVESEPDFNAATQAGGGSQLRVVGSNIWDPDGYFVELNKLLD